MPGTKRTYSTAFLDTPPPTLTKKRTSTAAMDDVTRPSLARAPTLPIADVEANTSSSLPISLSTRSFAASRGRPSLTKTVSSIQRGLLVSKLSGLKSGSILGETTLPAAQSLTKKASSMKKTSVPSGLTKFVMSKCGSKDSIRVHGGLIDDVDETEIAAALESLKSKLPKIDTTTVLTNSASKESLSKSASKISLSKSASKVSLSKSVSNASKTPMSKSASLTFKASMTRSSSRASLSKSVSNVSLSKSEFKTAISKSTTVASLASEAPLTRSSSRASMARSASLRLSTGAADESEVGGGLEAPPGEMLRADAADDSEVGNSLEAPPGEIMELRADAVDESEAGGSLEAPPGEIMELRADAVDESEVGNSLEAPPGEIMELRADAVDESEAGGSLEAPPGELMELAISFHTKGSMYRFLEEVRSRIQDMLQRLQADIPGIRIAIIVHGDYSDLSNYVIKWIDFGASIVELCDFVNNVERTLDGDGPACYELVLLRARQALSWTPGSKRALIVINDSVPHPPGYTYGGNTYYTDWRYECAELFKMGVTVYGVHAHVRARNVKASGMFNKEMVFMTGGRHLKLHHFPSIIDFIMLISYREANPDMIPIYEEEMKARRHYLDAARVAIEFGADSYASTSGGLFGNPASDELFAPPTSDGSFSKGKMKEPKTDTVQKIFGTPTSGGMLHPPASSGPFGSPGYGRLFGTPTLGEVLHPPHPPAARGPFSPGYGGIFGTPTSAPGGTTCEPIKLGKGLKKVPQKTAKGSKQKGTGKKSKAVAGAKKAEPKAAKGSKGAKSAKKRKVKEPKTSTVPKIFGTPSSGGMLHPPASSGPFGSHGYGGIFGSPVPGGMLHPPVSSGPFGGIFGTSVPGGMIHPPAASGPFSPGYGGIFGTPTPVPGGMTGGLFVGDQVKVGKGAKKAVKKAATGTKQKEAASKGKIFSGGKKAGARAAKGQNVTKATKGGKVKEPRLDTDPKILGTSAPFGMLYPPTSSGPLGTPALNWPFGTPASSGPFGTPGRPFGTSAPVPGGMAGGPFYGYPLMVGQGPKKVAKTAARGAKQKGTDKRDKILAGAKKAGAKAAKMPKGAKAAKKGNVKEPKIDTNPKILGNSAPFGILNPPTSSRPLGTPALNWPFGTPASSGPFGTPGRPFGTTAPVPGGMTGGLFSGNPIKVGKGPKKVAKKAARGIKQKATDKRGKAVTGAKKAGAKAAIIPKGAKTAKKGNVKEPKIDTNPKILGNSAPFGILYPPTSSRPLGTPALNWPFGTPASSGPFGTPGRPFGTTAPVPGGMTGGLFSGNPIKVGKGPKKVAKKAARGIKQKATDKRGKAVTGAKKAGAKAIIPKGAKTAKKGNVKEPKINTIPKILDTSAPFGMLYPPALSGPLGTPALNWPFGTPASSGPFGTPGRPFGTSAPVPGGMAGGPFYGYPLMVGQGQKKVAKKAARGTKQKGTDKRDKNAAGAKKVGAKAAKMPKGAKAAKKGNVKEPTIDTNPKILGTSAPFGMLYPPASSGPFDTPALNWPFGTPASSRPFDTSAPVPGGMTGGLFSSGPIKVGKGPKKVAIKAARGTKQKGTDKRGKTSAGAKKTGAKAAKIPKGAKAAKKGNVKEPKIDNNPKLFGTPDPGMMPVQPASGGSSRMLLPGGLKVVKKAARGTKRTGNIKKGKTVTGAKKAGVKAVNGPKGAKAARKGEVKERQTDTVQKRESVPDAKLSVGKLKVLVWSKWNKAMIPISATSNDTKDKKYTHCLSYPALRLEKLFDDYIAGPALYEFALTAPGKKAGKKHVVYIHTTAGHHSFEYLIGYLIHIADIKKEIDHCMISGCSLWVRKALAKGKSMKVLMTKILMAEIVIKSTYDYAWLKCNWRKDGGTMHHRQLSTSKGGVTLSHEGW